MVVRGVLLVTAMLSAALGMSDAKAKAQDQQSGLYSGFSYPNGKPNAISLSFDDGRHSQVDVGMAILDKYQVKATFYAQPEPIAERLAQWQTAINNGHELGNHTSHHLCSGNFEWLRKKGLSLEQTTLAWLENDIKEANHYFKKHLGVTPRAFAYPCGHTFVGRGKDTQSYVPLVATLFDTGRTWNDETANNPNFTDFAQLTGIRIDGLRFARIKKLLERYRENNSWIILAGHDIGKRGPYTVDTQALEQLLAYINDPNNGFWVGTVSEVADYVRSNRTAP
ncbi:polysaccharide deacetylase [Pseudoalteromonas ruthenica]|uniref:Polysaccharide deacetylase n=3 Tax=Pseudoalteromonas ruthenica TaxID=151081 RepID=A0A0F4PX37_9GAMM|nr:polysaccharide deacetylase [Pseudoalteromonas ruthenica]KJZ00149.1 polysaccharide deacetylase [Pseudoalteromonas ruthenica]TMO88139.1 polysaccharide deacetylase [Pseudoalteromonas ruthenica]TMO93180.1 polysaccharide deacetylase [Pseudoalteromonas ruthenica]TMP00331.1 polysaccharide deacetylase [Pseudoalteromonas ruthenica]